MKQKLTYLMGLNLLTHDPVETNLNLKCLIPQICSVILPKSVELK